MTFLTQEHTRLGCFFDIVYNENYLVACGINVLGRTQIYVWQREYSDADRDLQNFLQYI